MVEREIRGGICHAIHRYAKTNNEYMRNFDKKIISSYLMYLDANNLYGWGISQTLPVNGFKWVRKLSKFDECFKKDYDENSNKGYILEVDVEYPKNLFNLLSDLPFLLQRNKVLKCNKLVCSIRDKENHVVHIRALKQALNHGLIFNNVHKITKISKNNIKKYQKTYHISTCLKSYIDMNTKLRTEGKNDFQKAFFKLMNNTVIGKTMENVRIEILN